MFIVWKYTLLCINTLHHKENTLCCMEISLHCMEKKTLRCLEKNTKKHCKTLHCMEIHSYCMEMHFID